jgi:hypothetical protein
VLFLLFLSYAVFSTFDVCYEHSQPRMATRYCTACLNKLSLPLFLRDASSLEGSKVFATCYLCREKVRIWYNKKRSALQEIDPNIGPPPAQQCATLISRAPFRPSMINQGPILPVRPPVYPVQPSWPPLWQPG